MKAKKLLSLCMALVMALSVAVTPALAAADQTLDGATIGGINGEGTNAGGYVERDIWSLEVPTVPNEAFNFVADPFGIIEETDGAAFGDQAEMIASAAADNSLLFPQYDAEGNLTGYSNKSYIYSVTSKSSFPITIAARVALTGAGATAKMDPDGKFTKVGDGVNPGHYYLAAGAVAGTVGSAATISSYTVLNPAAPVDLAGIELDPTTLVATAFEVVWTGTEYAYEYTEAALAPDFAWPTYNFQLTGAVDQEVSWKGIEDFAPQIAVTWAVTYDANDINDGDVSKHQNSYTVTFDMNGHGEAVQAQMVKEGQYAIQPAPAPTAEGYEFGGWYKEPECTNAFVFASTAITENTTVYAKWTATDCAPYIVSAEIKADGSEAVIVFSLGVGSKKAENITNMLYQGTMEIDKTAYTYNDETHTITFNKATVDQFGNGIDPTQISLKFSDGTTVAVKFTDKRA